MGLNCLACTIGKLKYFDFNMVVHERLVYAKPLIEVTLDNLLLSSICIQLAVGYIAEVRVRYGLTPNICASYHSFVHFADSCKHPASTQDAPPPVKIQIPRPLVRM